MVSAWIRRAEATADTSLVASGAPDVTRNPKNFLVRAHVRKVRPPRLTSFNSKDNHHDARPQTTSAVTEDLPAPRRGLRLIDFESNAGLRPCYQRNKRRPSRAPTPTGINIPSTYQTARNGACISGQWKA